MNNDEVLSQLRDIHLPEVADTGAGAGFAIWPFIVFGTIVCVILAIRIWNRNAWRRQARNELAAILSVDDPETRWARLLRFASELPERAGRRISLPRITFQRPEALDEGARSELVDFLNAELRR